MRSCVQSLGFAVLFFSSVGVVHFLWHHGNNLAHIRMDNSRLQSFVGIGDMALFMLGSQACVAVYFSRAEKLDAVYRAVILPGKKLVVFQVFVSLQEVEIFFKDRSKKVTFKIVHDLAHLGFFGNIFYIEERLQIVATKFVFEFLLKLQQ